MSHPNPEFATSKELTCDETSLDPAAVETPVKRPDHRADNDSTGQSDLRKHVQNSLERYQNILSRDLPRGGLSTGYSELDDMTCGLQPGRIYVVAGRPSMGKTSLLLQILGEVCLKQQIPSVLFSGDLSVPEVIDRLIFNRALAPLCAFYDYSPSKGDLQRIIKSAQELNASGLVIHDSRNLTIEAIAAHVREARTKTAIGLIVIDHLHTIHAESTGPGTSRKDEMTGVIREIRSLARELKVPILVSAHIKRRADGRLPRSGDIRESGTIEYEADFIGLLHKECTDPDEDCFEFLVAKNNYGPSGAIRLLLTPEIQRFEELPNVPSVPSVPSAPNVPSEEQEMTRAWRDYQSEKDFSRETG